ncbi:MAG: universal stress protein [Chloroflexi bacterium]|nr:universal stress protein [Chloroflexota bacterium]
MQMYKTALVPLDGSELAEVVFNYARELAGRLGIDLILLHVYSPEEAASEPMRRTYLERVAEIIRRTSEEAREKAGIRYGDKPVKVTVHVSPGYPPDEILKYADANDVDLILMATHGRTGVKRWTMGSVADKVLRASKVPVWLVRAEVPEEIVHDKWPTRKLLALLDGSEVAEAVLPHVEAVAKQRGAEQVEVILLTVSEAALLPSYYPATIPLNWEDHVERTRRSDEEYLVKVEKRLKEAGLNVRHEVIAGRAADVIVDYVNRNSINLIVMSTHGRSGISRWVFGSVAEKLLVGVTSPILLIRPR